MQQFNSVLLNQIIFLQLLEARPVPQINLLGTLVPQVCCSLWHQQHQSNDRQKPTKDDGAVTDS